MPNKYLVAGSIAIGITMASVWATAQDTVVRPVPHTVVFGENVGFRIEGRHGNTPVGRIVLKHNGQWIVAELGAVPSFGVISQK